MTFMHFLTDPKNAANVITYFVGTHLVLWDWRHDTVRYHKGHDIATQWSVDAKQGLLCSWDNKGRITVWNMHASRGKRWLPDAGGHHALACLSPDGKHLALRSRAAAKGSVRGPTIDIWNLHTGKLRSLATVPGHPLAFHPDGRQLLVGSNLCNIDDGTKHTEVVDLENRRVVQAVFSAAGKRLYMRLSRGDTAVWDAGTRKLSCQKYKRPNCEVLPQPNGRYAVVMDPEYNLRVYDDRTGRLLHQIWEHGLHVPNAPDRDDTGRELNATVVSPDGVYLANSLSLQDGAMHKLRLWHLPTGKVILDVPTKRPQRPAFSPDGKRFLFFSDIGQINIWDLATRQPMFRLRTFAAVTRSTGSTDQLIAHLRRLVAASADHGVTVWDRDR